MGFSTIDYLVLLVYLAGITVFGMRFRQAQRTVKDYFLGARDTSWIIICLSIVAHRDEHVDADRRAGAGVRNVCPAGARWTLTYLQVLIGYIIGRFIIARLFLPSYFTGDLLTAYALLERRFGAARATWPPRCS